jgi:hypothetical protein
VINPFGATSLHLFLLDFADPLLERLADATLMKKGKGIAK